METSTQNVTNDVPAYLNDLIPYRCPKCGHQRRFATLRELRVHLQNDHSFQMGCIKPHSRATTVFSKDADNTSKYNNQRGNEHSHVVHSTGLYGRSSEPRACGNEKGTKATAFVNSDDHEKPAFVDVREASPLLQTFKDETNVLEMELQQAKQNEMRNKAFTMKQLSNNSYNPENRGDTAVPERGRREKQNHNVTVPVTAPVTSQLSRSQLTNPDMKSTLDKLNAEVMRSRLNQWVTSDALYKSQDILTSMEEAADANVREQQGIVQQLVKDIRNKGQRIEERERDERELLDERHRLYNETEHLVKEADTYNNDLRQELDRRSQALENLTTDMKRLQSISEKELKTKENDLQFAQEKMQRLEWERDKLIDETENILKRADTDNVQLRNTIKQKEDELSNVNQELHKLRQNQHAMLEQTTDIQTRAEKSERLMKSVIDAKNDQLESATRQLQEMKSLQGQLMEESKILTEQADDNTHAMKRLLQNKEDHVRELTVELQRLQEEKFRLEESTSSLEVKAERSTSVIESLRDIVKRKETDLKTTQSELTGLKEFLQTAAAKERGARKKLEKFIDDLILRAEKAETELRTLRSQSTNSSSDNQPPVVKEENRVTQQRKPTVLATNGGKQEQELLAPFAKDGSDTVQGGGVTGSTERLGLPQRLSPAKPPRTKLKLPNLATELTDSSQGSGITARYGGGMKHNAVQPRNIIQIKADIHRPDETPTHADEAPTQAVYQPHSNRTGNHGASPLQPIQHQRHVSGSGNEHERYLGGPGNARNKPEHQLDIENDDSNTINTDSLLMYLNEGLLTNNKQRFPKDDINSRLMYPRKPSQFQHNGQRNAPRLDGGFQRSTGMPRTGDGSHRNISTFEPNNRRLLSRINERGHYNEATDNGMLDLPRSQRPPRRDGRHYDDYLSYSDDPSRYPESYLQRRLSARLQDGTRAHGYDDHSRQHVVGLDRKGRNFSLSQAEVTSRSIETDDIKPRAYQGIDRSRPEYNNMYGAEKRYRKRTEPLRETQISPNTNERNDRMHDRGVNRKARSPDEDERYYKLIERLKRRKMLREMNSEKLYRYDGVGKSKRSTESSHARKYRSKTEKVRKLGEFDSTFPEIYNSMHDVRTRSRHRSRETHDPNSRRSRSLSPAVRRHVTRTEAKREHKSRRSRSKKHSESESNTDAESTQSERNDDASQKYGLLDESSDERGKEEFVELMDEKGILWASNEGRLTQDEYSDRGDDTLPDISDSELDRVSPSGSEAIATKKTIQVATSISSARTIRERDSRVSPSRRSTLAASLHSDRSKSTTKASSAHRDTSPRSTEKKRVELSKHLDGRRSGNGERFERPRIVRISRPDDHHLKEGAVFQPIKTSSRHSLSDKDLTSGGKEVHEYVKQSPVIHIKGSSETVSELFSKRSNTDSNDKSRDRNTETLEDKLARISDKYKSQRVVIGSSKSDKQKSVPFNASDIDNKVKLINDKYKAKRQAIAENKEVVVGTNRPTPYNDRETNMSARRPYSTSHDKMVSPSTPYLTSGHSDHNNQIIQHGHSNEFNLDRPRYTSVPNLVPGQQYPFQQGGQFPQSTSQIHHGLMYPPMPPGSNSQGQTGQMHNPYIHSYTNPGGNNGQMNQSFPYLYPYFYPNAYPGLQVMAPQNQLDGVNPDDGRNTTEVKMNSPSSVNKGNDNDLDISLNNRKDTSQQSETKHKLPTVDSSQSKKTGDDLSQPMEYIKANDSVYHNRENVERPNSMIERGRIHSPMTMKESDIDTERHSAVQQTKLALSHDRPYVEEQPLTKQVEHRTLYQPPTPEHLKEDVMASLQSTSYINLSNELRTGRPEQQSHIEQLHTPDMESTSVSEGTSMFAVPIEDDSSAAACDSNTQSVIDLHDTDIDTDTESVKRDFFDKASRIRGMLADPHVDEDDSVSQRSFHRNTMSSASSQASIDFLENIPYSRREETKRRRQALSSIFRYLDTASLCKVAEVCREWKIVSRSPKLWTRIELRNEKVSQKFLYFLARRSSQLKVLILEDIRPRNRMQGETVEDYQGTLKRSLDGAVEQILKRSEASLHTISIVNCGTMLSSKCLWAASCYSRMLQHVTYITDFDPISSEVMWALGSGVRDLQTLVIHPVNPCQNAEKFNTRCAQLIGKCFPVLVNLSIGGKHIDVSAVVFIAKQCQKLRHIELHHMSLVTKDLIEQMCEHGFTNLRAVKLMSTPIEPEGITMLHEHCKYLDTIYLRLSVNDYFIGTGQAEDLKVFEEVTTKYEELKKNPKLRRILKLKINKI